MNRSRKYSVLHNGRRITRGASYENAANLARKLGRGYDVWNLWTRTISNQWQHERAALPTLTNLFG